MKKHKSYPCISFQQGTYNMVLFAVSAKELYSLVTINRRVEDKKVGYQRALSPGRTKELAKFINGGNPIPTNIVLTLDANAAKMSKDGTHIEIDETGDAGWVIDGQHRLAGAHEAQSDITLGVTAFLALTDEDQVRQFVIINKEAKRVPTSLYLDLLPDLKGIKKSAADASKERAVDIANALKVDEMSAFYNRVVALKPPAKSQLSLTNFVRKIAPIVNKTTGTLRDYGQELQAAILSNFYLAFKDAFPEEYDSEDSIFFKTLGFGAIFNNFGLIYDMTINRTGDSLTRGDFHTTLETACEDFDFTRWAELGTGSQAENLAGKELTDYITERLGPDNKTYRAVKV